jgi:hypothetical protein
MTTMTASPRARSVLEKATTMTASPRARAVLEKATTMMMLTARANLEQGQGWLW